MKRNSENFDRSETVSIFVLMAILFAGVLAGVLLYCNADEFYYSKFESISVSFIKKSFQYSFLQLVVNSFAGTFFLVLVCFFLGFGSVFQPVELLVPLFKGLGLGISLADMYYSLGFNGLLLSLMLIIPNAVISSFALIIACRESIRMSNSIKNILFGKSLDYNKIDFRLYITKFIIVTVILGGSSLLDGAVTILFLKIVNG
jgi:uncharacterized membrane protein SpoIIM required for sporulation